MVYLWHDNLVTIGYDTVIFFWWQEKLVLSVPHRHVDGLFDYAMLLLLLYRYGSDKLKREFLAPLIAGQMVACIGVSEPHAGSDVASTQFWAVI